MYFNQRDVFRNLDKGFVKRVMDRAETVSMPSGGLIFRLGDPAEHFYVLLKGRIRLIHGTGGHTVHVVSHAGEAFGWSSLVGRATYSAAAECTAPCRLLRFDRRQVRQCAQEQPAAGMAFYERLAALLGERLLLGYARMAWGAGAGQAPAHGTGQVTQPAAAER